MNCKNSFFPGLDMVDSAGVFVDIGSREMWRENAEVSIPILLNSLDEDKHFYVDLCVFGKIMRSIYICSDDDREGSPNFRTNIALTLDGKLMAYPCRYGSYYSELDLYDLYLGDEREIELLKRICDGMQRLSN